MARIRPDEREWYAELGRRLRYARQVAGFSQQSLGVLANIEPARISQAENGRIVITASELVRLRQATGLIDLPPAP